MQIRSCQSANSVWIVRFCFLSKRHSKELGIARPTLETRQAFDKSQAEDKETRTDRWA